MGAGKTRLRQPGKASLGRLGSHAYYYELLEEMTAQCRADKVNWPIEMSKLIRLWQKTRARRALTRKESKP